MAHDGPATAATTTTTVEAKPSPPPAATPPPGRRRRRALWVLGIAAVLGVGAFFSYPAIRTALTTVSTDDAYVDGHVTYVAPEIAETVVAVKVDDNDLVRRGDLLVVLEDDNERVAVEQAEAALEVARRAVEQALAEARATSALAVANHFKLVSAMTGIRNQVASLRAAVAQLDEARAAEKLARAEAGRFATLARRGAETAENVDIRAAEFLQAQARTRQAEEEVRRVRTALELPAEPADGKPLADVPDDIDQRHSTAVSGLAAFGQNLAALGLPLPHYDENPDDYIDRIHALAPNGDIDALIERTSANAPTVDSARAQVRQAQANLDRARLDLEDTRIFSQIDGFVSNRNVNPGNRVQAGQRLMAIRSATEVWVDCNFKETQLEPILIGQPVDLYVDAYPDRVFRGRVSGFSPGTGQSLALLPAQNATGNFVKIVQRLPVRVDLVDGNPTDTPLFIGLSVVPYVKIHERPTGPNAGRRLRGHAPTVSALSPASPLPPGSAVTSPPTESHVAPLRENAPPPTP